MRVCVVHTVYVHAGECMRACIRFHRHAYIITFLLSEPDWLREEEDTTAVSN